MFLDMLLLSRVVCGMKRKLHYHFITVIPRTYAEFETPKKSFQTKGPAYTRIKLWSHTFFSWYDHHFLLDTASISNVRVHARNCLALICACKSARPVFDKTTLVCKIICLLHVLKCRSVTRLALQVTGNYSKIFANCRVDLYTVLPLMMQFLVLKRVLTYTWGRLIHEYIW